MVNQYIVHQENMISNIQVGGVRSTNGEPSNYGLQGNNKDKKYHYFCVNVSHHNPITQERIKYTTRSVHLMVADCWMRPPTLGEEICHGPKGHRCNHVDNLRWGTHTSNMSETRGRLKTIARRRRVKNTGVGNLTPLINEV